MGESQDYANSGRRLRVKTTTCKSHILLTADSFRIFGVDKYWKLYFIECKLCKARGSIGFEDWKFIKGNSKTTQIQEGD